jgi:Heterokaryon incompatibility protein (HET)
MKSDIKSLRATKKYGFEKIEMTCQLARENYNLKYAWVDSCCIDKSSSAELSESINSMFKWYSKAVICFAFLEDWKPEDEDFAQCKWFTRGWTLQELLASQNITFYAKTWQSRGTKRSRCSEIAQTCRITESILTGEVELADLPIAVRMSWAADRVTTREEDIAYSLTGLFNVNMPMLYGEGHKFLRLQKEIIKDTTDMSIFAWIALPGSLQEHMGIFAPSPKEFRGASNVYPTAATLVLSQQIEISITNRGVKILAPLGEDDTGHLILPTLHYGLSNDTSPNEIDLLKRRDSYGVYLRVVGADIFVRAIPHQYAILPLNIILRKLISSEFPKSISAKASDAIGRQVLCIREPSNLNHPTFGLVEVQPNSMWFSSTRTIVVGSMDNSIVHLRFNSGWADEFGSFVLVCRFRNPRGVFYSVGFWQCDLIREDEWTAKGLEHYMLDHNYALSCHDGAPSLVSRVLELDHLQENSSTKRVEVSLYRERDATFAQTRFFLHLIVGSRA